VKNTAEALLEKENKAFFFEDFIYLFERERMREST